MKEKISLQDLSVLLADKAGITKKDAETFLREYFEVLNDELIKSELIKIKDLGAFKLSMMEERQSIDVTSGERMLIPAHYKVIFTPDKSLAETVNAPFAFFETTEIEEDILDGIESFQDAVEVENKEVKIEEQIRKDEPDNEENSETLYWESERKCHDCHDQKAHRIYRKKYNNAKIKIRCLRIIISVLSVLLLGILGYFIYLYMHLKTQGTLSLSFFKYSMIIN